MFGQKIIPLKLSSIKAINLLFILLFGIKISFSQSETQGFDSPLEKVNTQNIYKIDNAHFNKLMLLKDVFSNRLIDSAISHHDKLKASPLHYHNELCLADIANSIGNDNLNAFNYSEALKHFELAFGFSDKYLTYSNKQVRTKASVIKAEAFRSIGNVCFAQCQNKKALNYYVKSLHLYDNIPINSISYIKLLINVGDVYLNLGDELQALSYYRNGLQIAQEINNKYVQATLINNIGYVYFKQLNYPVALENFFNALSIAKNSLNNQNLTQITRNIGEVYFKQKNYSIAQNFAEQALLYAKKSGSLEDIKLAHQNLYLLFQQRNQINLALNHYKEYVVFKDSLDNIKNNKAIIQRDLQALYDKKAAQNSILNSKAQEMKDVLINKNKQQIKMQNKKQIALLFAFFAVFVYLIYIYYRYKVIKRQKVVVE